MKTIATAGAKEALVQMNKARKVASRLMKDGGITEIRQKMPDIPKDATPAERAELIKKQGAKNFSEIVDVLIDKNIDDFFELVALLLFQTKKKTEQMPLNELIEPLFEIWDSKAVQDFLASLERLGKKRG